MRSKNFINIIFLLVLIPSCDEEPPKGTISFKWVPNEFSEYGANFHLFRTGDDNKLYALGFFDSKYGVHRAANGTWETVIELNHIPRRIIFA